MLVLQAEGPGADSMCLHKRIRKCYIMHIEKKPALERENLKY